MFFWRAWKLPVNYCMFESWEGGSLQEHGHVRKVVVNKNRCSLKMCLIIRQSANWHNSSSHRKVQKQSFISAMSASIENKPKQKASSVNLGVEMPAAIKQLHPKQPFYIPAPVAHCTGVCNPHYQLEFDVHSGCHGIDPVFPSTWSLSWEPANALQPPLLEDLARSNELLRFRRLSGNHNIAPRKHHCSK